MRTRYKLLVLTSVFTFLAVWGYSAQQQNLTTGRVYFTTVPITGSDSKVAQTGNIGATTLFTAGSSDALYLVAAQVSCDSVVATGTALATLSYTDISNTLQSLAITAAACTTLGAASVSPLLTAVNVKAGTVVSYTTTTANSPHYVVRITALKLT